MLSRIKFQIENLSGFEFNTFSLEFNIAKTFSLDSLWLAVTLHSDIMP